MIKKLIYFCSLLKWFILGGEKPKSLITNFQLKKNDSVSEKWSKEEYRRHFRNAASNMGMLPEARKWWNSQPMEFREAQKKEWEKRYGKNWRKRVVL